MKTTKRILSLLLVIVSLCSLMVIPTSAASATVSDTPQSGNFVRIRYAANNKYLDVPAEGIANNGTQLQIWDYAYGNQNQIFRMVNTGKGWQIISHQSGKVVEVRNSSHNDCAQVAQWDKHSLSCARWDIVYNGDGTISFRNRESSKFLNVCGGGNAGNGTKLIQYHNDGTVAMKFYIEVMKNNDVLSATYTRKIKNSELRWTQYNPFTSYTSNFSGFQKIVNRKYYHPTVGQKIFVSAEFLSPNTVANLLKEKSYSSSTWKEIGKALAGDLSEECIMKLLKRLDFGDVPGIGTAFGILQILWDSRDNEKWNRFVDTVQFDNRGKACGVIVYTYYTIVRNSSFGPLNNGTTKWGWRYYINRVTSVEYKSWTGDNFGSVKKLPANGTSGSWYYAFK